MHAFAGVNCFLFIIELRLVWSELRIERLMVSLVMSRNDECVSGYTSLVNTVRPACEPLDSWTYTG